MPNILPILIVIAPWFISVFLSSLPFILANDQPRLVQALMVGVSPIIFIITFISVSGFISMPAQRGIKKGKFPRQLLHPVYFLRRIYGTSWTTIYYFRPLYSVALSIPLLRKWMLLLFGYRGSHQFVLYPDTWIRDLPLLSIGKGAYLANRATIGTNLCLSDGKIFVDHVKVDEGSLVGHLAILGPGVKIGQSAEIGVGATVGIKTRISNTCKIGIDAMIDHGVVLEEDVQVGNNSYIGLRVHVSKGIRVPPGANIPAGTIIRTQSELNQYYSSETKILSEYKLKLINNLESIGTVNLDE